jgi:1-acyl-sn-glycerol-3-phosphate acyltransferase
MLRIKTVLLFGYLFSMMIVLTFVALLCGLVWLVGARKAGRNALCFIASHWARSIVYLTGCTLDVRGVENIPKTGGVCLASNHSGIFDIPLLISFVGRPFGFIAKRTFLFVPFLNVWISMLGGLFIERDNARKALKTIQKGIQRIKQGEPMLIFPEGTRSRGRGILPFKAGALKLATEANVPVVPTAIHGSYELLEKTGLIQKVNVKLYFMKPIDPSSLPPENRRRGLAERVREEIAAALGEPLGDG